ncbi:O-acyltransferase WSD1-like [Juglans microcarpa x Juglans regia]|uniref:O-acyltransferase WSD1-like n=1 Tax=Juglans microcarpa x Juglans regia TaxID=2249226 RepID=UPI001B7E61DB|nr:O-acyltransferase WSD1-like [Juglans microcarpa x Juglans regia]
MKVNLEDHVIVPELDPNIDFPDRFVEDYVSNLTRTPLDLSKPLWELHLLNIKTSDAEAVAVFRIHHSMGDGASLTSLLLACTRKTSDPEALPSIPVKKGAAPTNSSGFWWFFLAAWWVLRLIRNTLVDVVLFVATSLFLKDMKTPIKGEHGVERNIKRFVHQTVSLDDIKLVKNAMNHLIHTVNDVLVGVVQAGLSRYLNRRYGEEQKDGQVKQRKSIIIPKCIRLRAIIPVNLRKIAGIQVAAAIIHRAIFHTTMAISGLVGPQEEISFYGHPIAYLAPSGYGHPIALTVHFQSYAHRMTLALAVDPTVIPDPHLLCEDLEESLKLIRDAVLKKKTYKGCCLRGVFV